MGIIIRQSFYNSIFSYLGALLGLINLGILMPHIFSASEIGLISVLIAIATIFSQFGSLGFASPITRDFAYFRDKEKKHHGFSTLIILVAFVGFIISVAVFFAGQDLFLKKKIEEYELLNTFYLFIVPLIGFGITFILFDTLTSVLYNSVLGGFLREVLTRLLNLALIILYFTQIINFKEFVTGYTIAYGVPSIVLLIYLFGTGNLSLNKIAIPKPRIRQMVHLAFYSQIISLFLIAVSNIDKILIQKILNLGQTGIYSIAFLFGTIVILPSRALSKISSVIVADAWKEKNTQKVFTIYKKSSLSMLFLGSLMLMGIWINIDLILHFLPSEYAAGKYIILLIGLSGLIEMSTGVSSYLMITSEHYKQLAIIVFLYLIIYIGLCLFLIPKMGIIGAGLAAVAGSFIYNLIRHIYIWLAMKMQPFDWQNLLLAGILIIIYFLSDLLPHEYFKSLYLGSVLNSILVCAIYLTINEKFNIIEELTLSNLIKQFNLRRTHKEHNEQN